LTRRGERCLESESPRHPVAKVHLGLNHNRYLHQTRLALFLPHNCPSAASLLVNVPNMLSPTCDTALRPHRPHATTALPYAQLRNISAQHSCKSVQAVESV